MKHTPGPWNLSMSQYANTPFVIFVGEKEPNYRSRYPLSRVGWIAEVRDDESPDHATYEANAHLMAAAPEMYEALRQARGELQRAYDFMLGKKIMSEVVAKGRLATINKMSAAIEKADGKEA